jgi:hypothetical protein
MKTRLFAAAAIVAVAFSGSAFAQTVGSVGAAVNYDNLDTSIADGDGTAVKVDGSVAIPTGQNWTVTLNGNVDVSDNDLRNDTVASGTAHLTTTVNDWRVGGFTALSRPNNDTLWAVGAEAQKYLDNVTLSAVAAYGQSNDLDADLYSVRGEVRYFVTDDFRLNGGAGYSKLDGARDADVWDVNVGGEYKFANTGWSTFGKYTHTESDDLFDLKDDSVSLGVRYTFGGSLKARDHAGADLIDADTLFGIAQR